MKFRQNEFYAIEGNLLNLLTNDRKNGKISYFQGYQVNVTPIYLLDRIINETIELDCQENNCTFNKERVNDEK